MSDSVGSVSVDVVPDARGWSEKLKAQLRDQVVKVKADAETDEAKAKIDEAARNRTSKIKVKADVSQLSKGASALDKFVGNLGLLPALAIAGGAALIPLAGALGGVVAALAAPLAIAGGGATLFGVLAGFAVKDTEKQLKAIDSLQKKVDTAKQSLSSASTDAGIASAQERLNQALKDYHDALHSLSPEQQKFSDAQGKFKAAFQSFIGGKAGTALLEPLVQGMNLLSGILPKLTPILVAASGAFSDLLGSLGKATAGSGFDKFIHTISGQVGHDIEGFGRTLGNIAGGIGGLFLTLDKHVGSSMVDSLERLSGSFSDWANSKSGRHDVRQFLDYFHEVGPQVAHTIGTVAGALGHMVEALAPLGPPVLHVISGIADAISSIPVPVLTALAGSFVGLTAFQKVGGIKAAPGALRMGQNALSAVTGGLIPGAKGKGVVPVFVTNEGFGGGGAGKGGFWNSTAGKVAKYAGPGTAIGAGLGVAGLTGIIAGTVYGAVKTFQMEAAPGRAPFVGGMSPQQTRAFNRSRLQNQGLPVGPDIKSTTNQIDGLQGAIAQASHQLDLLGPQTAQGFVAARRSIAGAGAELRALRGAPTNAIDGLRARAATASHQIDLIGPHAAASGATAVHAFAAVQARLAAIHDKRIAIRVEDAAALAALQRLQAMQIADKSFTVYQRSVIADRNVGPGGGMGRIPPTGAGGGASGSSGAGASGRTAVHVHLDATGRSTLSGFMDDHYRANADADRAYEAARHGR